MNNGTDAPSLRSRIAGRTPPAIRKAVRMAEHYLRRHRDWIDVLAEMRGATAADKAGLLASACLAPITSLAKLDGYRGPRLVRDLELETRVGRFRLRAGTDDILHVLKAREPHNWNAIAGLLREGDIFVDGGANIGFYSLLASRTVGPRGKVIAIEMVSATAAILRRHIADNGADNVVVVERPLSRADGEIVHARIPAGKFGQATIVPGGRDETDMREGDLETITLDTALEGLAAIRMIKLDLEGAEFLALAGAPRVLARTDAVLFESNARDQRIFELLARSGFAVEAIGGNDFLARRGAGAG